MRRRTAFAAAALPLLLTAVACGTAQKTATGASPAATASASGASASGSAAPAATLAGPLGDAKNIKVEGASGVMPKVTFPEGNPALNSSSRVIVPGDGTAAKDGDTLVANVSVYTWDGKENKVVGSAYDKGTPEFVPINQNLPKTLHDGLVGMKPGGRVLVVIAKDSLDQAMIDNAKQQGTDFAVTSQVLVIDVVSAAAKAAVGTAADPGIEGVKLVNPGGEEAPTLTTKTVAQPPKDLVVKTVIKGEGPKVKENQTVMVHYTGKIWGTDQEFDSSWKRGEATQFPLNQVVKGWSQGLTGVPVGSRVVITIPPELGYGKEGNPQGGIKGTDTLVFVVDVLGAV
ncbi:peptidylprolyl isomerase [Acrocarpospora phusangensis]|uniref:peptidylprolyl isomerase n=1 Tax=Acrocarpospora phusangensis TaxID=1070424 RepID=A0A919UV65_9ACTN|nr:FKBP-type peptidyl-prolyl cis-trans isomerase [Acrocarpospora phusangensis]GIH29105.1 peptidylprolyl isomerase [Acrocarpospora phusangensis]